MFLDLQHISNDGDVSNHSDDEFIEGEEGIIDIGGITTTNESEFPMDGVGGSNEDPSSNVSMEKALACLSLTMQEIIEGCKQGGVMFMTMPPRT